MALKGLPIPVFTIFFIILAIVASCAVIKPSAPEVNLVGLKIVDITLTNAEFLARLKIYNPNNVAVTIKEVDYELMVGGVKVSKGRSLEPVRIGAFQTGEMDVRLSSSYWEMAKVLSDIGKGGAINFMLDGDVKFGTLGFSDLSYRFKKEGSLPLSQPGP